MMIRNVCLEDLQDIIDIERKNFSAEEAASLKDMKETHSELFQILF